MNRVTSVKTLTSEADVLTTYELDGLVKTLVANNKLAGSNGSLASVTTAYTYNRRRMLTKEEVSQPPTPSYLYNTSYGYNANGHLASFTYPDKFQLIYAPDALGRPTRVGSLATNISYWPNGAIAGFAYGNALIHTMTQNDRGLPASSVDKRPDNSVVALSDSYAYDANGNVLSITDGVPGGVTSRTMSYDGLDRLLTAISPGQWATATYAYDPLDNLRIADLGGPSPRQYRYNYDTTNRLSSIKTPAGATVYGFTYDARGNQTAKGAQTYTFDSANRLASVVNKETYRYDGLGRRASASSASGTMLWVYTQDGRQAFSYDGRRSQNRINVYLGNTMLATRTWDLGTGAINWRYVHTDSLGSPVAETDASGQVVTRNSYEPYGAAYGSTSIDGIGYTGHVMDQATGLIYMQQRFYDPHAGRFLSIDPVSANPNTGANFSRNWYANNNPYATKDPDGRSGVCAHDPCAPKAPINGTAQSSINTPTHASTSLRIAKEEAAKPETKSVSLNQSLRTVTGNKSAPNIRPDISVEKHSGDIDMIEIRSYGQTDAELANKLTDARAALGTPGRNIVLEPDPVVRPLTTVEAVGLRPGGLGAAAGILGPLGMVEAVLHIYADQVEAERAQQQPQQQSNQQALQPCLPPCA
jgi:RHS repeat-associated protein